MASEIFPVFSARALFVDHEILVSADPATKNRVRIDFAIDCMNKSGQKKSLIPMELASKIGAFLSVKVDLKRFDLIKHFLVEDKELNITICPLPWKVEGASGMFFDLIEIENFGAILETL